MPPIHYPHVLEYRYPPTAQDWHLHKSHLGVRSLYHLPQKRVQLVHHWHRIVVFEYGQMHLPQYNWHDLGLADGHGIRNSANLLCNAYGQGYQVVRYDQVYVVL